jgi:uncharacterized protein YjbJ (UPF0337 family)
MNESTVSGKLDQAKGSVKQALGETFNDQTMANEGAADQIRGHAKEAWGNVKDTAHDLHHSDSVTEEKVHAEHGAHSLRSDLTNAAESAKESIQRGLDHLENHSHRE